jgi:hypothetical protein
MAKPYSADLRRRVVGTIEGGTTIGGFVTGSVGGFDEPNPHVLTTQAPQALCPGPGTLLGTLLLLTVRQADQH